MANSSRKNISTINPVGDALDVRSAADIQWSDSTDVIVVGWGGAGASAAIEAREQGADVLVIDRFSGGGARFWRGQERRAGPIVICAGGG